MRFIDLFAGLGGFHLALSRLGHTCVFASENDADLQNLYEKNFGIKPHGDIREIAVDDIPGHDILCAGFPCQPFSKAGDQQGFECPRWGDLFDYVLQIVRRHKPDYVLLENVPNLKRHNKGRTWQTLEESLRAAGYNVDSSLLSPHFFGIPQIRERVFIVGSRSPLTGFVWPNKRPNVPLSLASYLDVRPKEAKKLSEQVIRCLEVWQDFLNRFPKDIELPSFPIWSMEFGANYPYEEETPFAIGPQELASFRGSHGKRLQHVRIEDQMSALPSYARVRELEFPKWKVQFIQQNRELYQANKAWIKEWLPQILEFPPSLQKFEWNCKGEVRDIWKYVIQFRASGVRVKRPTTAPSLIAMTTTQVPIIAWEKRYMTPHECARIQSLGKLKHLPTAQTKAFKALGNAVNASLVEMVAKALIPSVEKAKSRTTKRKNTSLENTVSEERADRPAPRQPRLL